MKASLIVAFMVVLICAYSNAAKVNCPIYEEGKEAALVPHPCNCNTYYVCYGDDPIPMKCPRGLHFNREKKQCDWPRLAKCVLEDDCPKRFEVEDTVEQPAPMQEVNV